MGFETAALIGLTAVQASGAQRQARAEAKSVAERGTLDAANAAKQTVYRAATQRQSFLSSGLTLEGTPMSVINETIATGGADVGQIATNANRQSKAIISAGRSKALGIIASAAAGASFSSGNIAPGFEQSIGRQFSGAAYGAGAAYGPQQSIWN